MLKYLNLFKRSYLYANSCLLLFLSNNSFAENVIAVGNGAIEKDKYISDFVSLINWSISAGGAAFASLLGFGALKHIKEGHYSSGLNGLTASGLAGGITYFVHTYFAK